MNRKVVFKFAKERNWPEFLEERILKIDGKVNKEIGQNLLKKGY